jgi:hypothetical protein
MTNAMRRGLIGAGIAAAVSSVPAAAAAHTLVVPYTLPVPFWMYLFACGATLVLTFAVLGVTATAVSPAAGVASAHSVAADRAATGWLIPRPLVELLRVATVFFILLVIVGGLIGSPDPSFNIAEIGFWIGLLLAFNYLSVLIGDLYQVINPWRAVFDWAETAGIARFDGRVRYPAWLGYWPAFIFYIGVVWLELMVLPIPAILSYVLIAYSAITLVGVWLFGKDVWFHWCDYFSVFFRMVGLLAPVEYTAADSRHFRVRLRLPVLGALRQRPEHISLVLFILFMLSSTTYDGLKDTGFWQSIYWSNLLALLQPLWGSDLAKAQAILAPGYDAYLKGGLLLAPFLYLAIYLVVMWATKMATGGVRPVKVLALDFAFSVVPIAVVYNFAHYYAVLLYIWTPLPYILSDPFAKGWNLLGLTLTTEQPPVDMGGIWNTEVVVILAGHLASVYLAHAIALRVFPSQRVALRGEIPLLFLMVAYTFFGLFVLSLPLAIH